MPRNETLDLDAAVMTELSNADVGGAFTVQKYADGGTLLLFAAVGQNPPSLSDGSIELLSGQGVTGNALQDFWPGIAGTRLYAYAPSGGKVMISHA